MRVLTALHDKVFARRTRSLARHLAELIPANAECLDVGCGDGTIDELVLSLRPDVTIEGIDVLARPNTKIPVSGFDGRRIPFPAGAFDAVVLVDVLHHAESPASLLRESARVARRFVIIKDHLLEGLLAAPTLRFMDWVGNDRHGVALPYNYWRSDEWRKAFDESSLSPEEWRTQIGLYPYPASLFFERGLHFVCRLRIR